MSSKTIVQKLRVKEGQTFLLLNAPEGYQASLADLPSDTQVKTDLTGTADVIQCFVTSRSQLEVVLPDLKTALNPNGILWIAYPKGTSRMQTDVNRDVIRSHAETVALRAVAIFSIDETWSSLRLKVV